MWSNLLAEVVINHRGKVLGVIFGLIFGWFLVSYGILKTLVIVILTGLGYFLGKRADEEGGLRNFLGRIFGGQ